MPADARTHGPSLAAEFRELSHQVLQKANRDIPRIDFLYDILKILIGFSGCHAVELWLKKDNKRFCGGRKRGTKQPFAPAVHPWPKGVSGLPATGVFWNGTAEKAWTPGSRADTRFQIHDFSTGGEYESVAIFPLVVADESVGFLQLKSEHPDHFTEEIIELYERFTLTLGIALVSQGAQAALRERVKELTCLCAISKIAQRPGISVPEILGEILELLPPAWQYPVITFARIVLEGISHSIPGFPEHGQRLKADIVVQGQQRGKLEVAYSEEKPELDEGPFLKEECSLIDAVAREIGLIVERKQVEEERTKLHEQLTHADRLATIGQLAAGVAHELNEPLGTILGLAQLSQKCPSLPQQLAEDLGDIVDASLHSREVIKKVMVFARQMPPTKSKVDLNHLVEEGLYFLEARSSKAGIELVRQFSPDLPQITGDPAQLTQVLINLVVNALQAMPDGGHLTIQTLALDDHVCLIVEDTGMGMSEKVMDRIFVPFFTTKNIDEGTGLGLPVVQGIVTAHRGTIKVTSQIGQGSRFEVQLPVTRSADVEEAD